MTAVDLIQEAIDDAAIEAPPMSRRSILVATDGSEAADAAFAAAKLIAGKHGSRVHVLSVVEPLPPIVPGPQAMMVPPEIEIDRLEAVRAAVQAQARVFDPACEWDLDIRFGRPAEVIARFAREHDAGLIIIGSHRHGVWGRLFGEETAMEIARTADVPLLVASHGMKRLPKRVMVALDIKPSGLEAMPAALGVVADTRTISCVHVKPRAEFLGIDWAEFDSEYEMAMWERFRSFDAMLEKCGFRGDLVVLNGDVSRELANFAPYSKAELLVVGINRKRGRLRTTGGRLAGRMLRHVDSSILIVPGNPVQQPMHVATGGGVTTVLADSTQWSSAMKAFTARNAGRICTLEIDDPELGALVEAHSYPLLGVDYDHRDCRLTVSVGETKGTDRHLARSVRPESISVLSFGGRDTALSVAHGSGQTLLTFS